MAGLSPTNKSVSASFGLRFAAAVLIVMITIAAYWPALHAGFIWDDDQYVWNNPLLLEWEGLKTLWFSPRASPQYYPVVFTTFWVEHKLWGFDARGYHWVNVVLHAINALLVWRVSHVLKIPGAWLIGAVFAVHPVHVESVAWITERKNVLSGFFYLTAMLAYLRFDSLPEDDHEESATNQVRSWLLYVVAIGFFALALLSKSVTCSLPAAMTLIMLWQRKSITIKRLAPLLPFFVLGLALGLHTASLEREHVGASGHDFDFSFAERLLIACNALLFYPGKVLWPHPLIFVYPRWTIDTSNVLNYWPVAVVILAGAGVLALYWRGTRGPFLALAFFAGTVFPALGFFNVYPMIFSFVADHFQYLASLGVIALVIGAAARWLDDPLRIGALSLITLPTLMWLTSVQAAEYHNLYTLWTRTLERNDDAWLAHTNLSPILLQHSEFEIQAGRKASAEALIKRAREHSERAVELKPDHCPALSNYSEALRFENRFEEALAAIDQAIARIPNDPNYHFQRGRLLDALGRRFEAVEAYRKSLEIDPNSYLCRAALAQTHIARHELAGASQSIVFMEQHAGDRPFSSAEIDLYALESLAESCVLAGEPGLAVRALAAAARIAQRHQRDDRAAKINQRITAIRMDVQLEKSGAPR